jgi:hypothetical protein
MRIRAPLLLAFSLAVVGATLSLHADDEPNAAIPVGTDSNGTANPDDQAAKPGETPSPTPSDAGAKTNKKSARRIEKADAFIAPPDWEFDGFVSGGQDSEIRSLYYLNDLVYLNVGTDQGFTSGDRISIYKRGQRVRDPQTGKFLGYEVRRAATTQVTDRIEGGSCSVRILQANEAVEIGDLVRRAE